MKKRKNIDLNKDNRPPCKVTTINEPKMALMAKAFNNLYYQSNKGSQNEKEN